MASDNVISVTIIAQIDQLTKGMNDAANQIQSAATKMEASVNKFSDSLDNVGVRGKKAGDDVNEGLSKIDTGEARGGIMVLGEEIGVHLPRHVQALIATLPGLGAAFSLAFPILAIVAVGKAIEEFVQKADEAKKKLEEQAHAAVEASSSIKEHADQLTIDNHKLEDQLAILQKKPTSNGITTAADEAEKAMEKLIDETQKAIDKLQELFAAQATGGLAKFLGTGTNAGEIASHLSQGLEQMKGYLDDFHRYENMGDEENAKKSKGLYEEKKKGLQEFVTEAMQTLKEIQTAPDPVVEMDLSPDPEGAVMAQQLAVDAMNKQREAAQELLPLVQTLYGTMLQGDKAVAEQIKHGTREGQVKSLEQTKQNSDLFLQLSEKDLKLQEDGQEIAKGVAFNKEQFEVDYWTTKLGEAKQGTDEYDSILMKQQAAEAALRVKNQKDGLDEIKTEIAATKEGTTERIAAVQAYVTAVENAYGRGSKEGIAAEVELTNAIKAELAKRTQAQLEIINSNVSRGENELQAQLQLDKIYSQQKTAITFRTQQDILNAERDAELKRHEDTVKFLQLQEDAYKQAAIADPANAQQYMAKARQLNNQIEAENNRHNVAVAENESKSLQARAQAWKQYFDKVNSAINQNVDQLIKGQETVQQAFANILQTMLEDFINYLLLRLEHWIENMALEALSADTGQHGITEAAAMSNFAQAESVSYLGAANAYAALAAFPPAAAAAAAAALTVGNGFAASALTAGFFAQGGMVPEDMLAYVHKEEMVLPRDIANKVLNGSAAGANGGATAPVHVHFSPQITAFDGQDVTRSLVANRKEFVSFVNDCNRKGLFRGQ